MFYENTSFVFSWAVPADRQKYTSFYWQFNGLQSQAYTTGGGVGFSQEVAITQPTILDDGYLDGDAVLYSYNYLINKGCVLYRDIAYLIIGTYDIVLDDISIHITFNGKCIHIVLRWI